MTVLYPTYLDFIGRIAMMRRRCELEKDWSVSTAQELEVVESKMKTLKSQDSFRKQKLQQQRQNLDDANRQMFLGRKELTLTHHRILGLEKLKNGATIDPQSSIDIVNKIRRELQENGGVSETFERLLDTECSELCDLCVGPTPYHSTTHHQHQTQGNQNNNININDNNNTGATPFVLSNQKTSARR